MESQHYKMNLAKILGATVAISFLILLALLVATVMSSIWEINWHPVVVKLSVSVAFISFVVCFLSFWAIIFAAGMSK